MWGSAIDSLSLSTCTLHNYVWIEGVCQLILYLHFYLVETLENDLIKKLSLVWGSGVLHLLTTHTCTHSI